MHPSDIMRHQPQTVSNADLHHKNNSSLAGVKYESHFPCFLNTPYTNLYTISSKSMTCLYSSEET